MRSLMGEPTERDDDTIRMPDYAYTGVGTLLWKKFCMDSMLNCPECTMREKKKVQIKYEEDVIEEERSRDDLFKLFDEIEYPMEMDKKTKHFVCRKCGLYATREQVGDIRERLNRREKTKEDRHDDYLNWWQKSKKDKIEN